MEFTTSFDLDKFFAFLNEKDRKDVLTVGDILDVFQVKKPETGKENKDIRKGHWYKCIEDCLQGRFVEGGEYYSEKDWELTDEYGESTYVELIPQYFKLAPCGFMMNDWISLNGFTYMVNGVKNGKYNLYNPNADLCDDESIAYVDKLAHLWTIDDAKDGDILKVKGVDDCFIFNGNMEPHIGAYGGSVYGIFDKAENETNWIYEYEVERPANREEREKFIGIMSDAGYLWNPSTKELRRADEEEERPIDPLIYEYRDKLTKGCDSWATPFVDVLCAAYKQGIEDYIKTIRKK